MATGTSSRARRLSGEANVIGCRLWALRGPPAERHHDGLARAVGAHDLDLDLVARTAVLDRRGAVGGVAGALAADVGDHVVWVDARLAGRAAARSALDEHALARAQAAAVGVALGYRGRRQPKVRADDRLALLQARDDFAHRVGGHREADAAVPLPRP